MSSLLTVRRPNKSASWYVDGKRVSQAAYDAARTGKDGAVRHYVEAR